MKTIKIFLLLIFISSNAFASANDNFKNTKVGFKLSKPSNWIFITKQQHVEALKNVKIEDEKIQDLITKYASAPLVAMVKYPEPFNDVNPSFKVQVKPIDNLINQSATDSLDVLLIKLGQIFKDIKLIQKPKETKISGIKSAYTKVHYSLSTPDGRTFPISSEIWIVPTKDYFFMIGVGTKQDEEESVRKEIKKIFDSIVIQ